MWVGNQVEAVATGGERIHLRQNKRERRREKFIEYITREQGQDSEEAICNKVVSGGCF